MRKKGKMGRGRLKTKGFVKGIVGRRKNMDRWVSEKDKR